MSFFPFTPDEWEEVVRKYQDPVELVCSRNRFNSISRTMNTNPTPLSPAAQAVWDAAWQLSPVNCGSHEDRRRQQIAAALRAAADQVVPEVDANRSPCRSGCVIGAAPERIRSELLAIADELQGAG